MSWGRFRRPALVRAGKLMACFLIVFPALVGGLAIGLVLGFFLAYFPPIIDLFSSCCAETLGNSKLYMLGFPAPLLFCGWYSAVFVGIPVVCCLTAAGWIVRKTVFPSKVSVQERKAREVDRMMAKLEKKSE